MIIGIGEAIANKWCPGSADFEQWANYIDASILLMCLVIVGIFIFYIFFYHRFLKIENYKDIFLQRLPWINTLWMIFIIHAILASVVGLAMISDKSLVTIGSAVILSVVEAGLGVGIYIILSIILKMPPRVKYVPYLKYKLSGLFGRR